MLILPACAPVRQPALVANTDKALAIQSERDELAAAVKELTVENTKLKYQNATLKRSGAA